VVPSSPIDAYGLLRAAIADPDPVIFFEPKSRYWSKEDGELDGKGTLPIGRARVVRDGSDCAVFAWGAMVTRALAAAKAASERGTEVRVVDVRSLVPLDVDEIGAAVRATGRAVVVHEAPLTAGFGAEIVARIVEEAFDHLEAPVVRVTGYDTPYPPATLEARYVPDAARILAAIERVVAY
jgi:pyruvate dehydrogenase E1 component beta subunit